MTGGVASGVLAEKKPEQSSSLKGLEEVISKLVEALSGSGGKTDTESGLGKMLKDKVDPFQMAVQGPEKALTSALEKLIGDKLGDDFGADKSGSSGSSENSGLSGLMDQLLSGLAKSSLDDLLSKSGEGSKFSSDDMSMLKEVGKFMDANPSQFPAPDSGSWANELQEDNFLNESETSSFQSAIDMIGSQLGAKASGQAGGDSTGQSGLQSTGSLGGEGGLGSLGNSSGQSSSLLQDLTKTLGGLMDGLQDLTQQLEMQNLKSSAMDAANALVGGMLPKQNS
ncbi:harpin HrpZ family protein [Pseudomonas sp. LRF_L74]|uniref:harpin HrpZ family protein n=1 Tax=Pseudomonas sp. LRF_L74 TaxID=3369422 RepID=UPI003F62ADEC